ncbi:AAA family ATPase [Corynebacterium lehmanniae]|nr:AAA family ATPase [Corynebacterium lehmanniae]
MKFVEGRRQRGEDMKPWIKVINLENDSIYLDPGGVLAVVGPNNSGKSKFLKQLLSQLYGDEVFEQSPEDGLISGIELEWLSDNQLTVGSSLVNLAHNLWPFREPYFSPRLPEGYENAYRSYKAEEIEQLGQYPTKLGPLVDYFTRWDEPHSRFFESEKQEPGRSDAVAVSLTQHEHEREPVAALFEEIFGEELSVYDLREGEVGFLLGRPPEGVSQSTQGLSEETRKFMTDAPKLWYQGAGLRNVFGLLARIVADDRAIVIMDEPESFLHPNQAWKLGLVIARLCKEQSKQLICATHDRHFLAGLAQGSGELLRICRLDYERNEHRKDYSSYLVPSTLWTNIRNENRVRYSTVLECFFSDQVILVEGESDARFYQEAVDYFVEKNPLQAGAQRELMFVPTGGNSEFAPMARLVSEMGAKVTIIGDADLISSEARFLATIESVAGQVSDALKENRAKIEEIFENDSKLGESEQDTVIRKLREVLEDSNQDIESSSVSDSWRPFLERLETLRNRNRKNTLQRRIARQGNVRSDNKQVVQHFQVLLEELEYVGIFLVPWGELEHFSPEHLQKGKQDWVHRAIHADVHKGDRVQQFIAKVMEGLR